MQRRKKGSFKTIRTISVTLRGASHFKNPDHSFLFPWSTSCCRNITETINAGKEPSVIASIETSSCNIRLICRARSMRNRKFTIQQQSCQTSRNGSERLDNILLNLVLVAWRQEYDSDGVDMGAKVPLQCIDAPISSECARKMPFKLMK